MIDDDKIEQILYTILEGETRIEISGEGRYEKRVLYVREPSISDNVKALRIYEKRFNEALNCGVFTENDIVNKLISVNLWSPEEQDHLDNIPEKIEDAKVALYLAYKNFRSRDPIRKKLSTLNEELFKLYKKRDILNDQTCEGFALLCKSRFLICLNTFDENGERFFSDYHDSDNFTVSEVIWKYLVNSVSDKYIRYISKKDVWRSFWGPGKSEGGVFGKPSIELTANQRALITWSKIYDSINDSPDCPSKSVIEDDDMIDGWLLYQGRKREKDKANKVDSEKGANVKGDEVFLFAQDEQDAKRIHDLNDIQGKSSVKSLHSQMKKHSEKGKGLKTENTIEAQLEMRQMANEQFKQKGRA